MAGLNITGSAAPGVTSVGGIMTMKSLGQMQAEERQAATEANNTPVVQGLAAHIRKCWNSARSAKEMTVEQRMLKSLRQRRGDYDPDKLALIREQGGSEVYMMLSANKCRSAGAWLRDVLLTSSHNKPWSIQPGGIPDLPPNVIQEIMDTATLKIQQFEAENGGQMSQQDIRQMLMNLKDQATAAVQRHARAAADRMEMKMLDQLQEGGFMDAMSNFIDDITTFPSAILKGPVVRKKKRLAWVQQGEDFIPDVKEEMVLEWERVDPFNAYPAADATGIEDGYFIERHRLSRSDLSNMIGVEGYSDKAIRMVLDEYGRGGLHNWLQADLEKAEIEGKSTIGVSENPSELIDAIQFWGSVQGKMLVEWGMDPEQVEDELKEYDVEVWLVGNWVIKAVMNSDPMGRKPYYKSSYEEIPGSFWGNSVTDLCRDTQDVCNAVARALVNNTSIASGPQVVYNVSRLPQGENLTQMYPWKVWQVSDGDGITPGSTQKMMEFFQPNSNAAELMKVFDHFAALADEYTGIPRYMTGDSPSGGAGRTASGMSMLMSNAGKAIKQVISNMDMNVIEKAIDRLYYYNMRYGDDPDLKGDVNIVASGAEALMAQEQTQQRRNEFLQVVLQSDVAQQVVGMEGVAVLIRENAKNLGMNVNEIVPPIAILKEMWAQQQAANAQMQQAQLAQATGQGGSPPNAMQGGKQLPGGQPVTNNFAPSQQNP